jgi:hypothetical protein
MAATEPNIEFDDGLWVELTAGQRGFVARKAVHGLGSARHYRDKIVRKYGAQADTVAIDAIIHDLTGLVDALGVDVKTGVPV